MGEEKKYQYDAFISYRHTEPDKTIAEKLHKMLETYKAPISIAKKTGKRKINRVFRDRDELPTSSDLAGSIQNALENSEYLIVICSPRTPLSQWVIKEIETFSKLHGHDKILALLIEGEPAEAFPEQLRFVHKEGIDENGNIQEKIIEVEPLAADIRGNNLGEMRKHLKTELLRLISPIFHCSYDDLKQRHRERFIRRVMTTSISIIVFLLAFGSFSAWQAINLKMQVNKTLKGQSLYLSNIASQLTAEGDRRTSTLLALEALPKNLNKPERPYVEEAEYALCDALAAYKVNYFFNAYAILDHKKRISDFKLNSDSTKVLTNCEDGYIYVWKASNGEKLLKLKTGNTSEDKDTAFFVNKGKSIVALTSSGVCEWNAQTGKIIWYKNNGTNNGKAQKLAVSDDSNKIAIEYERENKDFKWIRNIKILDAKTGKQKQNILVNDSTDITYYIDKIKFSHNGNKIGAVTDQGYLDILDINKQKEICKLTNSTKNIDDFDFSNDDKKILSISNFNKKNGILTVYDADKGSTLFNTKTNDPMIEKATFNSNDSNILAFTDGKLVNVVDIAKKKTLFSIVHPGEAKSIVFYNAGKVMLTASNDGTMKFSVLQNRAEDERWTISQTDGLDSMDFSNGTIAASSHDLTKIYLWQKLQSSKLSALGESESSSSYGKFSSDGKKALTSGFDEPKLYIWDVQKRKKQGIIDKFKQPVDDAMFVSDDKYISTISRNGNIELWDSSSLNNIKRTNIKIPNNSIALQCKYSDDGGIAVIYADNTINIVDTVKCRKISNIKWNDDEIESMMFSNNKKQLAVTGLTSGLTIYNVNTGKIMHKFKKSSIKSSTISSDSSMIAAAGTNKAYVYDAKNYKQIRCIKDIDNGINITSIAFNYDNSSLLVGLDDKTVRIYNIKTGKLEHELSLPNSIGQSELKKFIYRENGKILIIVGEYNDSTIWNAVDYKELGDIEYLLDIDKNSKNILTSEIQDVMILPHYTTKMLVDEAKKQLGGRKLTNKEKEDYFIME